MSDHLDIAGLQGAVDAARSELLSGLVSMDICDRSTGLSLVAYNSQTAAAALFAKVTRDLTQTLDDAQFAPIKRYYLVELEGDRAVVVLRHSDQLQSTMLLDSSAVSLGWLLSMVLPQVMETVAAVESHGDLSHDGH